MKKTAKISLCLFLVLALIMGLCACGDDAPTPAGPKSNSIADRYIYAQELLGAGQYADAAAAFDAVGDYEDAAKLAMYAKAAALGESGQYDAAIDAFNSFGDYKSSADMAVYYRARKEQAKGNYGSAIKRYNKIILFKDSAQRVEECKQAMYDIAASYAEQGDYDGAYAIFINLKGYKDVDNLLSTDENLKAVAAAAAREPFTKVGNYVTYGTYPQTAEGDDSTPIEWLVLDYDEKNSRVLLISRYGLDCQPYNTKYTDVTWETCSLRTWLNGTFLNKAFSKAEQRAILTTNVDNSSSQCFSGWSTSGGNNTQDKIFLLSYAEAKKYFNVEDLETPGADKNTKSRVAPTAYAIAQGAGNSSGNMTADGSASGWWLLRSPGSSASSAAFVGSSGSLGDYYYVRNDRVVVRPAFWLDLSGI